jgi:hypothetical protein
MEEQAYQPKSHWFLFFAGVILPAISITVEASTHICAEVFFDPLPSTWHLLVVIFVPLAQLQVWFAIRKGAPDRLRLAGFLNAAVIAISFFYGIVYLPIVPLGLLAVLIGLGFLPLAPYFSFIAAVVMRYRLKQIATTAPNQSFSVRTSGLLVGLAVTVTLLGVIELPATLTTIGLQKAASPFAQTRAEGIRFLRKYGSKDALLRNCYNQTGMATDLVGYAFSIQNPITPAEARKVYYRVTGETFDASAPPERVGGGRIVPQETFDFDTDQGGRTIAGKLRGLSLGSSQIAASVDANGAVGYLEWTMVFQNQSLELREARAEVQLPPGAVVSRLNLWVNGEPREAAFGGRTKVTQAYQQVAIRQRRDPVLVTTAGRDRVLVQCFPVPIGGDMKIRLGITIPLLLEDRSHARLVMPHFVNRNFRIPDDVRHSVWVESTKVMGWSSLYNPEQTQNGALAYSGSITDSNLSQHDSSIQIQRDDFDEVWSANPFDPDFVIRQSITEQTPQHLNRIVIVVDTSKAMRTWVSYIQSGINTTLPDDFDVKLVFAETDGVSTDLDVAGREEIWHRLQAASFNGGADNAPALRKAWELAAEKPGNNAIVWIHNPQGLLLESIEDLKQHWDKSPYGPTLYSLQTTSGPDEIMKQLDGFNEVKSVTRTADLGTDLHSLLAHLTGKETTLQMVRTIKKRDENLDLARVIKTSDHLARLWANDEVTRILAPRDPSLQDGAIMLATQYQLVTPVTGAVVLETEQQYQANGLQPVDAGTVPTIPEPEMVVLLIVAGAFCIWLAFMKYRKSGSGRCTV